MQLGRDLAQAQLGVAQLVAGALELGREPLQRRDRPLGEPDEPGGALAVVGRERVRGGRGALGELGDVAEPLALVAQRLLAVRAPSPRCPRRARAAPRAAPPPARRSRVSSSWRRRAASSSRQAARASPRGGAAAPRRRTRSSTSSWYAGRASRRCSNWPDMAITRSTAAPTSSRAAARPHAYARVRPSAKTRRETSSASSSSGRSSTSASSSSVVGGRSSSASTYASAPGRADERVVALRPEQEPDRLREDRLARTGLAGDRVEPGRELQLRLPDQHEILDAQPSQHPVDGSRAARRRPLAGSGQARSVDPLMRRRASRVM